MSKQYNNYLDIHINNVKKCHEIIFGEPLEEHDSSKYSNEEYKAYDAYFYGQSKLKSDASKAIENVRIDKAFDYAWLHHIHNNPHHWQYWVLIQDDGTTKPIDIPEKHIREMIADWSSFAYLNKRPEDLIEWYASHREKQRMTYRTRKQVDKYVELAYEKLKEFFENEGIN